MAQWSCETLSHHTACTEIMAVLCLTQNVAILSDWQPLWSRELISFTCLTKFSQFISGVVRIKLVMSSACYCRCCSESHPGNPREGHQTRCQRLFPPPAEQGRVRSSTEKDTDTVLRCHAQFFTPPMCLQWEVDGGQGDAGRLLCRNVPGHCHHTHGDAQDPAAGCWQAR